MKMRGYVTIILVMLIPILVSAQSAKIGKACTGPEYRQFDFWIGHWSVYDTTGTQIGSSHIARVADGCGIREEWTAANGSTGTSLNYYNKQDKKCLKAKLFDNGSAN